MGLILLPCLAFVGLVFLFANIALVLAFIEKDRELQSAHYLQAIALFVACSAWLMFTGGIALAVGGASFLR